MSGVSAASATSNISQPSGGGSVISGSSALGEPEPTKAISNGPKIEAKSEKNDGGLFDQEEVKGPVKEMEKHEVEEAKKKYNV